MPQHNNNSRKKLNQLDGAGIAGAIIGAAVVGAAWLLTSFLKKEPDQSYDARPQSPEVREVVRPTASFDSSKSRVADDGEEACCICLSNRADCLMRPCLHVKTCCACSTAVSRCPVCRTPIVEKEGPLYF